MNPWLDRTLTWPSMTWFFFFYYWKVLYQAWTVLNKSLILQENIQCDKKFALNVLEKIIVPLHKTVELVTGNNELSY